MSRPTAMDAPMHELVGQVVLGEHRLERVVRSDGALVVFESVSTVDQGTYTVLVAPEVRVETSATSIEAAIDRAGRHAIGLKGLISLLRGSTVPLDERPRLAVVRRGPAHGPLESGPLGVAEVARRLEPLALTLSALHEQGMVHGAVCPLTVVQRQDALALDFFGLGAAAEAASGARGSRDLLAPAYRPPELRGDRPATPGPWTDLAGLALVALELLTGRSGLLADRAEPPSFDELGLAVSPQVADLFARTLSASPRQRPLDARAFLRELLAGASAPVAVPSARPSQPLAPPPEAPRSAAVPPPPPSGVQVPPPAPSSSSLVAPPPPVALPPDTEALQEARQRRLLFGLVGAGVALMLAGTLLATLVAWRGDGARLARSLPSSPSASTSAPLAATAAPLATLPPSPRRGPATYPADTSALLPVAADAPVWGDREALVTVVIFGDLTCPFTARQLAVLPSLLARPDTDVRVVFKHYPTPGGAAPQDAARAIRAQDAAEAAAIVGASGGVDLFWRFLREASQAGPLDPTGLEALGVRVGLGPDTIAQGLAQHTQRAAVARDVELGRQLGVRGTPVLFVNGRRLDGVQGEAKLARILEHEQRRARAVLGQGSTREQLYARRVTANVTTSEGEKSIAP